MNNARRKKLEAIKVLGSQIETLLEEMQSALNEVEDEEQEAFDNRPEAFQFSETGQVAEAGIQSLEMADSELDGIKNSLESFAEYLDEACQ